MGTRITKLLNIKYPVLQGGMAWVATHELAAAVSEAGGLGIIASGNAPSNVIGGSWSSNIIVQGRIQRADPLLCRNQ
jgi:NAD(P)H-dependent flavin oxidoreductase YrpB (nitropropane dioxygenase family)